MIEKASGGKWIDYDASPKQASPDDKKEEASSDPDSKEATSGGAVWKSVSRGSPSDKSPTKSGETGAYSGFGFFSKEDAKDGDKNVISAAFKKYVHYFLSVYLQMHSVVWFSIFYRRSIGFFQICSLFPKATGEKISERKT